MGRSPIEHVIPLTTATVGKTEYINSVELSGDIEQNTACEPKPRGF